MPNYISSNAIIEFLQFYSYITLKNVNLKNINFQLSKIRLAGEI